MNNTLLSDEKLVQIIRENDQKEYSEIIKRYQHKLTHYLKKYIYDQDELEDVLQVVFIKTFKNLYGFNTKLKFSSWIYRIAHNEMVNHIKKNLKTPVPLDEVEYKIVDEKIDIDRDIDRKILARDVGRYLGSLDIKYREPVILFYFENKSYEEISDILRIPTSTVGTFIWRGKQNLADIIAKDKKYDNK